MRRRRGYEQKTRDKKGEEKSRKSKKEMRNLKREENGI